MSFGGSVHAMIISIRNNRNLLGKKRTYSLMKEHFLKEFALKAYQSQNGYQGKKVTAEELRLIKRKIKHDLKKQRLKSNILVISFTVLILGILYWTIFT